MAKESGIGDTLYVAQYDLSGDVGALSAADVLRGVLPVTSIQDVAESRILGLKDGALGFTGFWNTAVGQEHAVVSALPTTDRLVSYFHGSTVGNAAASMVGKVVTYSPSRGQDGSLAFATSAQANGYGLEWSGGGTGDGMLTTGKQTFASGTVSGTSIDLGSTSTLFGSTGYIHLFSVASGTPTFTIQDSADNVTFATLSGMAFTASASATSERIQGAVGATVRRYVRIQVTGTYTSAVAAINFIRYATSSAA